MLGIVAAAVHPQIADAVRCPMPRTAAATLLLLSQVLLQNLWLQMGLPAYSTYSTNLLLTTSKGFPHASMPWCYRQMLQPQPAAAALQHQHR